MVLKDLFKFTRQCVTGVVGEEHTDILGTGNNMSKGYVRLEAI